MNAITALPIDRTQESEDRRRRMVLACLMRAESEMSAARHWARGLPLNSEHGRYLRVIEESAQELRTKVGAEGTR